MFGIKLSTAKNTRPIRTIEREMEMTRARYQKYLDTRSDNYMAQRGDVKIKDPHTMAGNAYKEIREFIDPISKLAKKYNKEVVFEDARVLTRDDEFVSPVVENSLMTKVLVSAREKNSNTIEDSVFAKVKNGKLIDKFEQPEIPFMKKISQALGELLTGKKDTNFDAQLGVK